MVEAVGFEPTMASDFKSKRYASSLHLVAISIGLEPILLVPETSVLPIRRQDMVASLRIARSKSPL